MAPKTIEKCVKKVQKQGKTKEEAKAICRSPKKRAKKKKTGGK